MGNGFGDWVGEKAKQTRDWTADKYNQGKQWVKDHADEIDIATDFIPVVGQVKDAFYTIKYGWAVYKNPNEDNLVEFGFALIGWVPYAGDTLKGAFKIARKNPEQLLTAARYAMKKLGKHGDPEQFLYDLVSVGSLNSRLDYVHDLVDKALQGKWGGEAMRRQLSNMVNQIKSLISRVSAAMKRYLDKVLPHAPKTSARVSTPTPKPKASARPAAKRNASSVTYAKSKSQTAKKGGNKHDTGSGKSHNRTIDTVLDKALTGIIGEHMGDYWVAKELGYTVHHDEGHSYPFKLDGPMTMLSGNPRGVGIDSIWKTDHRPLGKQPTQQFAKTLYTFDREHAVVEYKASSSKGNKSLGSVLGKNKRKKASSGKPTPKVKGGKNQTAQNDGDENYQMSEEWGDKGLRRNGLSSAIGKYSRHVLFFGAVAIAEHALALSKNPKSPNEAEHRHHNATWVADGATIDQTISDKKQRARRRGKK